MDFKQKRYLVLSSIPWYVHASIASIASIISETLLFPLESSKIRLQIKGAWKNSVDRSFMKSIQQTIKTAGISGLYNGLGLTLLREFVYIYPKMYSFEHIKRYFAADIEKVGYYRQICPILASAFFGIFACNVLDLMRIKTIGDVENRNYTAVSEIWQSIIKEKGISGIQRGIILNFSRSTIFISAELAAFLQTKLFLMKKMKINRDSIPMHIFCCINASIAACFASCPLDVIRSRYMVQFGEESNYKNIKTCILDIIRNQGLKTFYRGFVPYVLKTIPSSLIFFTFATNMKNIYLKYISV